jgi:hypothetical protein
MTAQISINKTSSHFFRVQRAKELVARICKDLKRSMHQYGHDFFEFVWDVVILFCVFSFGYWLALISSIRNVIDTHKH